MRRVEERWWRWRILYTMEAYSKTFIFFIFLQLQYFLSFGLKPLQPISSCCPVTCPVTAEDNHQAEVLRSLWSGSDSQQHHMTFADFCPIFYTIAEVWGPEGTEVWPRPQQRWPPTSPNVSRSSNGVFWLGFLWPVRPDGEPFSMYAEVSSSSSCCFWRKRLPPCLFVFICPVCLRPSVNDVTPLDLDWGVESSSGTGVKLTPSWKVQLSSKGCPWLE